MRGVLAAVCVWVALAVPCAAQPGAQAEDARLLARVEADVAAGHAQRALRKLARALRRGTASSALALRYAELALPCSAPSRDEHAVEHAVVLTTYAAHEHEREQSAPEALRRLALHTAWALALLERWDEALSEATARGRRDDALTHACLARIAGHATRRAELEVAHAAVVLARNFAPADMELARDEGLLLLALGRPDAAVSAFSERFATSPQDLDARRDFAHALLASGRAGEALELLLREEHTCRADVGCLLELARTALEAGLPADAAVLAKELVVREPTLRDALFLLAEAHTRSGALAAARADYERVLALHPDDPRAKQALAALGSAAAQ